MISVVLARYTATIISLRFASTQLRCINQIRLRGIFPGYLSQNGINTTVPRVAVLIASFARLSSSRSIINHENSWYKRTGVKVGLLNRTSEEKQTLSLFNFKKNASKKHTFVHNTCLSQQQRDTYIFKVNHVERNSNERERTVAVSRQNYIELAILFFIYTFVRGNALCADNTAKNRMRYRQQYFRTCHVERS